MQSRAARERGGGGGPAFLLPAGTRHGEPATTTTRLARLKLSGRRLNCTGSTSYAEGRAVRCGVRALPLCSSSARARSRRQRDEEPVSHVSLRSSCMLVSMSWRRRKRGRRLLVDEAAAHRAASSSSARWRPQHRLERPLLIAEARNGVHEAGYSRLGTRRCRARAEPVGPRLSRGRSAVES